MIKNGIPRDVSLTNRKTSVLYVINDYMASDIWLRTTR